MTGYGRGEGSTCNKKFTLELRAVNHRYNEVVLRLPRSLVPLEDRIRRIISARVARGRIDGYLSLEECGEKTASVKVDKALASAYYKAMKELQESVGIEGKIKLKQLVTLPGVLIVEEPAEDLDLLWPAIQEAAEGAVASLVQMRAFEGEELAKDLLNRVEHLARLNNTIRDRSPVVVEDYRERLQNRLSDFLKDGSLDMERLTGEVVLFAERSNITEETVRLESHLNQVRNCLLTGESVGRKLDFLIQEMNREINTIASKASDLEISRLVVEVKSELEKLREQVQNIE
jgi:uncharacterized protein (TIGR00255 family)